MIEQVYEEIDKCLKVASTAQIGGFRPPEDKLTSWFGGDSVIMKGEEVPQYKGKNMFPLLKVKVSELPYIPEEISNLAYFVLYWNTDEIPFDKPHGDGWEIREYRSLENLITIPENHDEINVKSFPIKWHKITNDAPDWENAMELTAFELLDEVEGADERFFEEYINYDGTKIGGFPSSIQHGVDMNGFVFQVASEAKAKWNLVDGGIAYFHKNSEGQWVFSCQFF